MKIAYVVAASIAALSISPAQAADYNFDFTTTSLPFGGPDQNGSGIFTTSDVASQVEGRNAFAITGISGQINGVAISGLTDYSKSLIPTYYYYTDGPSFLNGSGVHFNAGAFQDIRFYGPSASPGTYLVSGNGTILANVNASTSLITGAAPEPATWAMLIFGFGIAGYAMRRRAKETATTACA